MSAKYIYSLIAVALFAACQPSGDQATSTAGETELSTKPVKPVYQASGRFQTQINEIVDAYLATKDALVASDTAQTNAKAKALLTAIQQVDSAGVASGIKQPWANYRDALSKNVQALKTTGQLAEKRAQFEKLSERMYALINDFGANATLYKQYCPMALNNKGAYWLSARQEIRNPYFGDQMLECGEVQEVLAFEE